MEADRVYVSTLFMLLPLNMVIGGWLFVGESQVQRSQLKSLKANQMY